MAKTEGKPGLKMGAPPAAQVEPAHDDPTQAALAQLGGGRGMIRTQTSYQTAITVQKPRDNNAIEMKVLDEASRAGESFIYSWQQNDKNSRSGKSTIEGISIDGAMILFRLWTNCALPTDLVDETPTHYLLKAEFIDLETGVTLPRLFRQRKSGGPGGKMDADRKEDIALSIGISKVQRNTIVKAIPSWLQDRAVEAAKGSAAKKYADVATWAPQVIEYAKGLGVPEANVVARIGKPVAAWTPYDVLAIRLIFKAIYDKETSAIEAFPPPEGQNQPDDGTTVTTTGEPVADHPKDGAKQEAKPGDVTATPQASGATAQPSADPGQAKPQAAQQTTAEAKSGQVGVGMNPDGSMKWETPQSSPVVCRICDGLIEGPVEDPKVVDGRVISGRHPGCAAPAKQEAAKDTKTAREPGEEG
jgi:hypothetical protein